MPGAYFAMGTCFVCMQAFTFNPHRVPSYQGEPICERCIRLVNGKRQAAGRPLWPVLPNAYGEEDES